ncbi:glycolipid transfer protein-like [Watersipora subatra]|uniref:glycolipid transfer protein-like n=1 Tax=Watersipora subatra TaxID=2589382 RepID=UPI00355C0434
MGDGEVKTFFSAINLFPECAQKEKSEHDSETSTIQTHISKCSLTEVLDAATEILPFFDIFGAFIKVCKNDFEGNINKLKRKSAATPNAKTFRQLLQYELDNKLEKKTDSACIVTLWFKRGLQFIIAMLEGFIQSDNGLLTQDLVRKAYEASLKRYHNWIVQKSVTLAAKLAPEMSIVISKLCYGKEGLQEQLKDDQRVYLERLKPVTIHLHNLLIDLGLDSEERMA